MRILLLTLLAVLVFNFSFGQARCGFDEKMKELIAKNPQAAENIRQDEQKIRQYIESHQTNRPGSTTAVVTIPVVVHVMHTGGAVGTIYNPSDAAIQGAISYLNQVYAGTYTGMEAPFGSSTITNMELTFALAQRTPGCGYTNGIDRVDATSLPGYVANGVNNANSNGCPDLTLKDFARWNPADYYNIWVVNKIDGADGTSGQFVAGYAYFAGASASLDGTVMLATQMISGQKTLPHEVGHAFNLYHTFQGSSLNTSCPVNTTCSTDGDMVCDTDPITNNVNGSGIYDFTCRSGTNTCTSTAYTKNTEKNFMSYTNCYTLFTAGQKTRVQAAMSLATRITLGTSLGATPCGTVINFALASNSQTENNAGTVTGCRRYTDYVYQVTIGAAPSATATVTLTYSGTATKGLDYEVTTNGNFTTPSNVLTFASGSTTAQSFTVRVFDDAAIETAETAIMNFTVNNGGGNAAAGTTIPTFTLTINDNEVAPVAGGNLSGGVGTYNINLNQPFRGSQFDARTQILYTAAELSALGFTAGNITSISFNVASKASTQPYSGFSIKLKNTSTTALANGAFETGSTTVYGPVSYSTTGTGVHTIPITAFAWNGTSNLLVDICWDNTTASGDDNIQGATSTANTVFDRQSTNATPGCSITNSAFVFGTSSRPILTFGITTNSTVISSALNSTKTAYLGPNEDVYFYDGSGNIMARIKNLTSFDYGCTQVTIDRAGTSSAQFWNSTTSNYLASKSIKVVPTNNTTTGSYQITLYYTAAEVTGWQTATSQTWANAKIVKVSNGFFIPDVTAAATHSSDVIVVTPSPAPAAYGSNYSITGTFSSTGFSGFGVGVPGTAACPTITVTNPATATGTVNTAFSQTFTQAVAGASPTFSLNTGTLPAGLTLSSAGVLSGTPTQSGTFPITVRVTDANSCTGTGATYNLVINCQTITVTNPTATAGTVGTAYSKTFTQAGGVGTTNFSLNTGTLPTGLTLSTAGVLSGTPTQSGSFPITVKATDVNGCTGIGVSFTVVINCQTITVTNPVATTGTVNAVFSQTFTQSGGTGTTTFSINSGTLPTGITLSTAGVLSGTPTQSGTFPLTIKATDINGCTGTGATYNLVIGCQAITVTNPTATAGVAGTAYSKTFTQAGGVGSTTFSLNTGTLPTGLTLSTAGVLSGTPTQTGTFPITVKATDANGCTGIGASFSVVINCQTITITNPGVSTGTAGTALSRTFTQSGGIGTTNFSLNSGTLPTGLTLSTTGVLSGTPTQTGSFPITVKATDGNGCIGTGATYTLVISCQTITVTNPATTTGTAGVAFSQTFTQSAGIGAITFSLNSGTLPTGLTLSSAGVLSGTPTQTGSFPITVKATDANGCNGTGAIYTLVISCQTITVTNPATTTGTNGASFSQTFTQTGAVGGTTFSLNSGTLPTGLTLSTGGVLSGIPTQTGTFPITVKVTGGNGCVGTGAAYNLVINAGSSVTLNLTLFLEAFYRGGSTMAANRYDLGLSADPTATDLITVNLWSPGSLANASPNYSLTGTLHTNGTLSITAPAAVNGNSYYIAVKHRNHMETWSSSAVPMSSTTTYNFSNAITKAYSDGINPPMTGVASGIFAFYGGDINQDGAIDGLDMNTIDNQVGFFGYDNSDINGDGATDGLDMNFVDNNSQLGLFMARP